MKGRLPPGAQEQLDESLRSYRKAGILKIQILPGPGCKVALRLSSSTYDIAAPPKLPLPGCDRTSCCACDFMPVEPAHAPMGQPQEARRSVKSRTKYLLLAFVGVAIAGGIVAEQARSPADRVAWDRAADENHAVQQCFRTAKANAHDPASADLVDGSAVFKGAAAGTAVVVLDLRAKNKIGAKVVSRVSCDLTRSGDSWKVTRAHAG